MSSLRMLNFAKSTVGRPASFLSLIYRSSSSSINARALAYESAGDPATVLKTISFSLPPPPPKHVRVKFAFGAINPADINVLQGVYPAKPERRTGLIKSNPDSAVYIPGNEGLGIIESVGEDIERSSFTPGDWVLMAKSQLGSWSSHLNLPADAIIKVPRTIHQSSSSQRALTEAEAATLGVNPTTAYRMLTDFVNLKSGDWIIQNGANSAVGIAVIQIAKARKIKTINLVRNREGFANLSARLQRLGADVILTYEQLADKETRRKIMDEKGIKSTRLSLNCVGGKTTTDMIKYFLGPEGYLVTYGGMSKQPVEIPTSLLIFKNITAKGFWMSEWYKACSEEGRLDMVTQLVSMIEQNKLQAPEVEIVSLKGTNDQITKIASEAVSKSTNAGLDRKLLFKFE